MSELWDVRGRSKVRQNKRMVLKTQKEEYVVNVRNYYEKDNKVTVL